MKKWVISDIHGCAKTLRTIIEERIVPDHDDLLYFVGDYIDRGPDSKGVIDYIISLEEQGYNVRKLKGNHEEYLLLSYDQAMLQKEKLKFFKKNKFLEEWKKHGGKNTLKNFNVKNVKNIPDKYINWIRNLEYYFEEEKYFIVHAGFDFTMKNPFEDKHAMLWIRSFEVNPEKIQNKKVIHGHVPVSLDFIKLCLNKSKYNFIPLDNGCFLKGKNDMGNLIAFEMNNSELIVQPNVEKS